MNKIKHGISYILMCYSMALIGKEDMYNNMINQFSNVGVDVVFLPHIDGISSTYLSEILQKLI